MKVVVVVELLLPIALWSASTTQGFPLQGANRSRIVTVCLRSKHTPDDISSKSSIPSALPSSQSAATMNSNSDETLTKSASVVTMINQESRRILIEELGYRRADVSKLRPDLAQAIIAKRMVAPDVVPGSWFLEVEEPSLQDRLASESRYPLKFPLLGVATILFGRGIGDFLITSIKVSTNFPGSSFAEDFMGVPVYLIDVICMILGGGIFAWTWKTMKA